MSSAAVARMGYNAWARNKRMSVTGLRNRVVAGLIQHLPREMVLRLVRKLQSPA
jgi:short-subunit dehydrogenase